MPSEIFPTGLETTYANYMPSRAQRNNIHEHIWLLSACCFICLTTAVLKLWYSE